VIHHRKPLEGGMRGGKASYKVIVIREDRGEEIVIQKITHPLQKGRVHRMTKMSVGLSPTPHLVLQIGDDSAAIKSRAMGYLKPSHRKDVFGEKRKRQESYSKGDTRGR